MDMIKFLQMRIELWTSEADDSSRTDAWRYFAEGKVHAYNDVLREIERGYLEV